MLTTEVLEALNFLPRTEFLGRIVRSAVGGNPATLKLLAEQVEDLNFNLLPGNIHLADIRQNGKGPLKLQPDGILESPLVYCMLEAKRIKKPGAFPEKQLAREFLAVMHEARDRRALLLLVLPEAPPVLVSGHGRLTLNEAVDRWLPRVLERAEVEFPSLEELRSSIDSILAYTTWQRIYEEVDGALRSFSSTDPSIRGSITRLANAVLDAIRWHGQPLESQTPEINWIECDAVAHLGHGVQFLHDELKGEYGPVAFVQGFGWMSKWGGSPPTVKLLTKCPSSVAVDSWSEVMARTREAVRSFLSNDCNLNGSFRHRPISVLING